MRLLSFLQNLDEMDVTGLMIWNQWKVSLVGLFCVLVGWCCVVHLRRRDHRPTGDGDGADAPEGASRLRIFHPAWSLEIIQGKR